MHTVGVRDGAHLLHRGGGGEHGAGGLGDRLVHGDHGPLVVQADPVLPAVAVRAHRHGLAVDGRGDLDDELPGELPHGVVVAVRRVRLHGGELGVVGGVRALVAEVAVELEDLVHPTHAQVLEVELRGDAQVQVRVVRVDVGAERAGARAAVHGLQHGGLHLHVAALHEGLAHGGDPP